MGHLHILNGDSTLMAMQQSKIEGAKMVWREVISEGRAVGAVGAEEFWDVRTSFFESFFEIEGSSYQKLTIDEFEKLYAFQEYSEITLWFEYDLFCQLNMMALLSWFAGQHLGEVKLSLVCVGEIEGYDRLVGLGEIDPMRYPVLFEQRQMLSPNDLEFATNFWMIFCSNDPKDLLVLANRYEQQFPYLPAAVKAHLKRFPSTHNGLNDIENRMLKVVHSGVKDRKEVVKTLIQEEQNYGFGDWQYFVYLKNLYPLLNDDEGLRLNALGEKVMQGEEDFMKWANHDYFWGGAYFKDYRWDNNANQLITPTEEE